MKYCVAWVLANLLYYLGHAVSRPIDWGWPLAHWLYRLYNWLMLRSSDVDAWGKAGVWLYYYSEEDKPLDLGER